MVVENVPDSGMRSEESHFEESRSEAGAHDGESPIRSAEMEIPGTRARAAGAPPAAGKISPAEKSEPDGVPRQAQRHAPDPNAPLRRVTEPGKEPLPESGTGGIPLTSLVEGPDLGTEEARRRAQIVSTPPPADAGLGSSELKNDPNRASIDHEK